MSDRENPIVLLPEATWSWSQLRPAVQRRARGPMLNEVGTLLAIGFGSVAVIFGVMNWFIYRSIIPTWSNPFSCLIYGLPLIAAYSWFGVWRDLRRRIPDENGLREELESRLEQRFAKLTGPRTAPGRAKAAHDDAYDRWVKARHCKGFGDPANRQVLAALSLELRDIKSTGGYQAYLEIEEARDDMKRLLETTVLPRLRREMLLTPSHQLDAADRMSQTVGMRARIVVVVTTDEATEAEERQRVEVASLGDPDGLDQRIEETLKAQTR